MHTLKYPNLFLESVYYQDFADKIRIFSYSYISCLNNKEICHLHTPKFALSFEDLRTAWVFSNPGSYKTRTFNTEDTSWGLPPKEGH